MKINEPIKSELSVLLNARKTVIVIFIVLLLFTFSSPFLLRYKIINNASYNMIFTLAITVHAIFCGRLYNIMSKNIILSLIIGILIIVLSWFFLGIGTVILTIYLLIKSNTALNYFSGIEEGTKFCSNCNRPLPEPKIPNTTENPYIKIKKQKLNTTFLGPKKTLDKESFSNMLVDWVGVSLKIRMKNNFFKGFLKSIVEFGCDEVMEYRFYDEIIYFYIWLSYINCTSVFQNKNIIDGYFPYFTKKIYNLFFMSSGCEEEEWEINLTKKINGYVDAYNLFLEGKGDPYCTTSLGREFYKNLYEREALDAITIYPFVDFVFGELKASFESLGKELTKYKI